MKDRTLSTIQCIALVILVVLVLIQGNKISVLENSIGNLQNNFSSLDSSISQLSYNLNDLTAEKQLVQSDNFVIENVNNDYTEAIATIEIAFNEIPVDSTVTYVYRTISSSQYSQYRGNMMVNEGSNNIESGFGEWQELMLEGITGGIYTGNIPMSYEYNYECKVIIEGGSNILTADINDIYLLDMSVPDYYFDFNLYSTDVEGNFSYNLTMDLFDKMQKEVGPEVTVVNAFCEIYYKDELIDTFELMIEDNLLDEDIDHRFYNYDGSETVDGADDLNGNISAIFTVTDSLGREIQYRWNEVY